MTIIQATTAVTSLSANGRIYVICWCFAQAGFQYKPTRIDILMSLPGITLTKLWQWAWPLLERAKNSLDAGRQAHHGPPARGKKRQCLPSTNHEIPRTSYCLGLACCVGTGTIEIPRQGIVVLLTCKGVQMMPGHPVFANAISLDT